MGAILAGYEGVYVAAALAFRKSLSGGFAYEFWSGQNTAFAERRKARLVGVIGHGVPPSRSFGSTPGGVVKVGGSPVGEGLLAHIDVLLIV